MLTLCNLLKIQERGEGIKEELSVVLSQLHKKWEREKKKSNVSKESAAKRERKHRTEVALRFFP